MKNNNNLFAKQIDWITTLIPFVIVLCMMLVFMLFPEQSKTTVDTWRTFFGDTIGLYYSLIGIACVLISLYWAFSKKYGSTILGSEPKPLYNNFSWGTMIFTSTMAADILFYSLCEWALYGGEPHVLALGPLQTWGPTFPLFHWGPIAWSSYVVLAVCFAYMIHVQKRERQRFSEAMRPLFGDKVDGSLGYIIDIIAVFAIVCATATTFSLATPLLTKALSVVFNIPSNTTITVVVLLLICSIYTITVVFGVKGISKLASLCSYLFFALLFYFLFLGGETRYIIETGFTSIGNLFQNFIGLSTYIDPLRKDTFAQDWTIYYWAYWLVWSIATPFFIAIISRGRTIKNVVLGTFGYGLAGTFMSFIIIGNYGLSLQLKHNIDIIGEIQHGDIYNAIMMIFDTLPFPTIALILLVITMVAFYSTTLDGITYVASAYSYKNLKPNEEPNKYVRVLWSVLFIIFPIALLFAENTLYSLQSVTIIAAFPVGVLLILVVWSFIKDFNKK